MTDPALDANARALLRRTARGRYRYRYVAESVDGCLTMEGATLADLQGCLETLRRLDRDPAEVCARLAEWPYEPVAVPDDGGRPFLTVFDRLECPPALWPKRPRAR